MPESSQTAESAKLDLDVSLMISVREGDEAALTTLIDRWKNPMINFFYRSVGSLEEAEELAMSVFIRLHRSAKRYEPRAKFSTFIFHVARRLLINHQRKNSRRPRASADPLKLQNLVVYDDTQRLREIEESFQLALKKLPENQRSALLLLKQQNLSYTEISEILEAPLNSVKAWIHRARQSVRESMQEVLQE